MRGQGERVWKLLYWQEIKAGKKERLPQHKEKKLLLWRGKEKREEKLEMGGEKKEEGIKKKKIV